MGIPIAAIIASQTAMNAIRVRQKAEEERKKREAEQKKNDKKK